MTTSHLRRTLVALSAATALLLAGCGGDDATSPATGETSESPTASDSPTASKSPTTTKSKKPKSSESASPEGVVVEMTVRGGEITPTAKAVELGVGEPIVLDIDSDRVGELHVHSTPEQVVPFKAGSSRHELTFDKPGSVDIEEHESGALIARVLVK